MKRDAVSKKLRFEVLKRDSFKCQYCGKSAPEVVLEIDHINPVARGGKNDILNLITSCYDCNHGKSDRTLGENNELARQKAQLDQLNERREQLKLMCKWKDELLKLEGEQVDMIENLFAKTDHSFNENGRKKCAATLKKYGFNLVYDAAIASMNQYLQIDKDGEYTEESISKAFNMYHKICYCMNEQGNNPDLKQLYYIRGILRNRFSYCDDVLAIRLLRIAYDGGMQISELRIMAETAKHWQGWRSQISELIEEAKQYAK